MEYSFMTIYVLMAFVLVTFIHGRPAVDESGLNLSMLESHASKLEDLSIYEPRAISSFMQGSSFSAKPRQKRLSDQRRAELETLMSLSRITGKRSLNVTEGNGPNRKLDLIRIGRRRRFVVNQIPIELISIRHVKKLKRGGDPAYPLVS
ncbi:uncharacterized protein [Polyergus mexicanus]|uniref:uncharacterized protein n=1 Tax=Polyergus mexicanus TaxID=615972 RepID=UPI0038B48E5F